MVDVPFVVENSFKLEVYKLVKKIPKGRVATYGQIAQILGKPRWSRQVGWPFRMNLQGKAFLARAVGNALHHNTDPSVPCHRVVDRNGRLAPNFGGPSLGSFGRRTPLKPRKAGRSGAFDGAEEQKRRLLTEAVKFDDETHVDLGDSLWKK